MDGKELGISDADNPEDVERLLRYIGRRFMGEDPEIPEFSRSEISKHDMLIVTDVITRVTRAHLQSAAEALQIEAEIITLLSSFGISDEHRT